MVAGCALNVSATLLIRDEKVYTNRIEIPDEGTVRLVSRILFSNYALAASLFDSLNLEEYHSRPGGKDYFSKCINNYQKQTLLNHECIDSVIIEKNRPDASYKTFPKDNRFPWSIDNFGPLVIPSRGMKISLNEENYILYNKLINKYEMTFISILDGDYFLNGTRAESYTFKNNY
jgi:signal peptidase I